MKLRIGTIAALAAGLTLAASGSAFAQGHGHGHDKDKDHGRRDEDNRQQQEYQGQQQRQAYEQQRQAYEQQRQQIAWQQQQQRQAYEVQQRQLRAQEEARIAQQRRDRYVYESRGNVGRIPPGLARKPGHMPPGQYKKYRTVDGAGVLRDVFIQRGYTVVRTQPYGESQYVYYRAPNGTLQRAIVSPGTNQLGFTNVPAELLQLVLSRLY